MKSAASRPSGDGAGGVFRPPHGEGCPICREAMHRDRAVTWQDGLAVIAVLLLFILLVTLVVLL